MKSTAKEKSKKFALRIIKLYKYLTTEVYIALKEAEETLYWLDLLKDSGYITSKMYDSLAKDCKDILKMLNKTTLTMSQKLNICTLHSEL